ncbi:MAG: LPS biosynthesis protein WbpP [Flammeovirgaceae bacterium TMED32]|nr:MAG: LPS biosynthesis protein WbpP [Flammeovirgaceae bacterium TMED32]
MRNTIFHKESLENFKFLITGGAGFIGSNLAQYLLKHNAGLVRIVDNLSNGSRANIAPFALYKDRFEFIEGDISDLVTCKEAVKDIDFISHQAALGSVPRSIKDPVATNKANIDGFLNMLFAAKDAKCLKKMVYAASSSTYGDSKVSPKVEGAEGRPLSPYAVTKLVNELYAEVFSNVYNLHSIGLRYFNIYGPKQDPNNPYAAVVPLFVAAALKKERPKIFGDGATARDFTYVENAVQANIKGMLNGRALKQHEVVNIACGKQTSLLQIWEQLRQMENINLTPVFFEERAGDIKLSLASIKKAGELIGYHPEVHFKEGLKYTLQYAK